MAKKQTELKGIEAPSIPELDEAAEEYVEHRDKRIAVLTQEIAAKGVLLGLMKKHKLERYRYDDQIVEVLPSEKLKVKNANSEQEEE